MKIEKIINIDITFENEKDDFEEELQAMEILQKLLQDKNEFELYASNSMYADVKANFDSVDFASNRRYIEFKTQETNFMQIFIDNLIKIKIYVEQDRCLCRVFTIDGIK